MRFSQQKQKVGWNYNSHKDNCFHIQLFKWADGCEEHQKGWFWNNGGTCLNVLLSQTLYDGKWHQLKILVRPQHVVSYLDDQLIEKVTLKPVEPIFINGKTQVAKKRGTHFTVPVGSKFSSASHLKREGLLATINYKTRLLNPSCSVLQIQTF